MKISMLRTFMSVSIALGTENYVIRPNRQRHAHKHRNKYLEIVNDVKIFMMSLSLDMAVAVVVAGAIAPGVVANAIRTSDIATVISASVECHS